MGEGARAPGGVGHQLVDPLGAHAGGLFLAVDHDLRGVGFAQAELGHIGLLALGELRPGEGVGPAEIVPVVDRQGQDEDARLLGELGHMGVGLAAGLAALGREKLDDHGRLGRKRSNRHGGEDQAEKRGGPHRGDLKQSSALAQPQYGVKLPALARREPQRP
jgi:hypothetical protein